MIGSSPPLPDWPEDVPVPSKSHQQSSSEPSAQQISQPFLLFNSPRPKALRVQTQPANLPPPSLLRSKSSPGRARKESASSAKTSPAKSIYRKGSIMSYDSGRASSPRPKLPSLFRRGSGRKPSVDDGWVSVEITPVIKDRVVKGP
jgi:hypothetical protein